MRAALTIFEKRDQHTSAAPVKLAEAIKKPDEVGVLVRSQRAREFLQQRRDLGAEYLVSAGARRRAGPAAARSPQRQHPKFVGCADEFLGVPILEKCRRPFAHRFAQFCSLQISPVVQLLDEAGVESVEGRQRPQGSGPWTSRLVRILLEATDRRSAESPTAEAICSGLRSSVYRASARTQARRARAVIAQIVPEGLTKVKNPVHMWTLAGTAVDSEWACAVLIGTDGRDQSRHRGSKQLLAIAENDRVVSGILRDGKLWVGSQRLRPSGSTSIACAAVRSVLSEPTGVIALAVPRGRTPLPVLLGLYLVIARVVMRRAGAPVSGIGCNLDPNARSCATSPVNSSLTGPIFGRRYQSLRLVSEPAPPKSVCEQLR